MNWQALNAACAFYTLGRAWSHIAERPRPPWPSLLALSGMVVGFWPLLWLAYGLDTLARRWDWFGAHWRKLLGDT